MNLAHAAVSVLAVTTVGFGAAMRAETLPIDRWLVSEAINPDSGVAGSRLGSDLLTAPGEAGVLPDRGLPAAGRVWRLVRQPGVATVELETLDPDLERGSVVYAHAYVRSPADRTLTLAWDASACTAGSAWLNGRPIAERRVKARFGGGWNTILIKLEKGDCPLRFEAFIESEEAGGLEGVEVRASRPPGEVRTGPSAWVIPGPTARIDARRVWADDRLEAGLGLELTAWGRSPVDEVEIELRGTARGQAVAHWLTPGVPVVLIVPLRMDRVERVRAAGAVEARLSWAGKVQDYRLRVVGGVPTVGDTIDIRGWETRSVAAAAQARVIDGQVPNAPGWVLQGKWKVPDSLAGSALLLVVSESPADYRVNGLPGEEAGGSIILCSPCRKELELKLSASTTGAWEAMPVVRVRRGSE